MPVSGMYLSFVSQREFMQKTWGIINSSFAIAQQFQQSAPLMRIEPPSATESTQPQP